MRKSIAALFTSATLAATALVGTTSASAGERTETDITPQATCDYRHMCVWTERWLEGRKVSFEFTNPDWRNIGPSWIHNNDESWWNNGAPGRVGYARVYALSNYRTRTVCLAPGDIYYVHTAAENRGTSNNWGPGC